MRTSTPRLTTITNHECSWWLRSRLNAIPTAWERHAVHGCRHMRGVRPSRVGVTALWKTDTLTCPDCMATFRLDWAADHVCDRCAEQSDTLHAGIFDTELYGLRLLVMFGLCADCHEKEGLPA